MRSKINKVRLQGLVIP